jgi:ribosomal protein S18 acetylase RimI-like enzyme
MITVDPGFRRHGIASQLVRRIAERSAAEGYDRVSLHVWADNGPACAFYRAKGFKEIARAPVPWHPGLPHEGGSILMRLSL